MEEERVQIISSLSAALNIIPPEFIRSEHEQPCVTTYHGLVPDIPVVDLRISDHKSLVQAIVEACQEWGIFQVVNHGISLDVIKELQRVGREFFELPQEEKEKYATQRGSFEGYGTKLQKELEGKKSWVDFFFHKVWPPSCINYEIWPINPPTYREANEEYTRHLIGVVDKLLGSMSIGLGLDAHTLKEAVGGDGLEYLLKINYYPPCPRPDLALGVAAHTDMSAITMLLPNEVPGLQVFKDGHWMDVKYNANAIIVHVGDQIEILSNGKYKSVLHRTTVNKEKARMSWPVFCSPPEEMVIGPLKELVSDENPAKYKNKKYKDYQYCKINKLPQ